MRQESETTFPSEKEKTEKIEEEKAPEQREAEPLTEDQKEDLIYRLQENADILADEGYEFASEIMGETQEDVKEGAPPEGTDEFIEKTPSKQEKQSATTINAIELSLNGEASELTAEDIEIAENIKQAAIQEEDNGKKKRLDLAEALRRAPEEKQVYKIPSDKIEKLKGKIKEDVKKQLQQDHSEYITQVIQEGASKFRTFMKQEGFPAIKQEGKKLAQKLSEKIQQTLDTYEKKSEKGKPKIDQALLNYLNNQSPALLARLERLSNTLEFAGQNTETATEKKIKQIRKGYQKHQERLEEKIEEIRKELQKQKEAEEIKEETKKIEKKVKEQKKEVEETKERKAEAAKARRDIEAYEKKKVKMEKWRRQLARRSFLFRKIPLFSVSKEVRKMRKDYQDAMQHWADTKRKGEKWKQSKKELINYEQDKIEKVSNLKESVQSELEKLRKEKTPSPQKQKKFKEKIGYFQRLYNDLSDEEMIHRLRFREVKPLKEQMKEGEITWLDYAVKKYIGKPLYKMTLWNHGKGGKIWGPTLTEYEKARKEKEEHNSDNQQSSNHS